ncbi:MAG: DUF917 family protein [Rhizobiales bacterium]|nr:DUF917 family protein [Hyphomicrobiales bacterium]
MLALRELECQSNKKIAGVFPIEIGAGNSTTPFAAALAAGIDMIDCDCAGGRAIPEMSQSTVALAGIPFAPAVFADPWGSLLTVSNCNSAKQLERLGKAISSVTKFADMRAQCARGIHCRWPYLEEGGERGWADPCLADRPGACFRKISERRRCERCSARTERGRRLYREAHRERLG